VTLRFSGVRAIAAALLLVAVCAAPARAALFDDDEARKRIEATNQRLTQIQKELDERIAALESQLKSGGLVEIFNQIEMLKADTARLRGQFEVLAHEQEESQKRQRDLYVDLDTRLRKLESAAAPPAAAEGTPPAAPAAASAPPTVAPAAPVAPTAAPPAAAGARPATAADGTAEQRSYDAALDLFKSGNYGGAIGAFATFTKTYPKSPLAPSAQYWIGNARYAQRDYRGAIAAQRQLLTTYPDSQKVPDALFNIATAQSELGDTAAARRTLADLVAKYPQSEAAGKARQRLSAR
jgi:tol-pal system protein YbgF